MLIPRTPLEIRISIPGITTLIPRAPLGISNVISRWSVSQLVGCWLSSWMVSQSVSLLLDHSVGLLVDWLEPSVILFALQLARHNYTYPYTMYRYIYTQV